MIHLSTTRRYLLQTGQRLASGTAIALLLAAGSSAVLAAPEAATDALLPLCTAGIAGPNSTGPNSTGSKLDAQSLGLYEVGGGLLAADVVDPLAAQNCLRGTPGNLTLTIGDVTLNLSEGVSYTNLAGPKRHIIANALDPVLCESYYTGNDSYALALANASDDLQGVDGLLGGVRSLSFLAGVGNLSATTLQATYGAWMRCHDATVANAEPRSADHVWSAGFENIADLRVEIVALDDTPIASMVQTVGASSTYRVRVHNDGEAAANSVRVREFLPKAGGILTPDVTPISCLRDADEQTCAGLDGRLQQDIASLAPGASLSYTLTRQVAGTVDLAAESGALLSIAAFSDPDLAGESRLADNSRSLRIGLQTLPSFTVSASVSGGNGTLTPPSQSVTQGGTATITLSPNANYIVNTVTDTCGAGGVAAGSLTNLVYSVPNITAACAVTASYILREYEVTAAASGGNGSIGPATQQVPHGSSATFTVTPVDGYSADVTGCGGVSDNGDGTWSTTAVTAACAVTATFSQNIYTVTPNVVGGNGTISPDTPVAVAHGVSTFFTLTPATNYRIDTVTGCSGDLLDNTNMYLISSVTEDCEVTASFTLVTYPVTAAATSNGAIVISTPEVAHGGNAAFTVTPAVGYSTGAVNGTAECGVLSDLGGGSWTAGPVTEAGCELSASFTLNAYEVTAATSGENGSIGPASQQVNHGSVATFTVTPVEGYSAAVTGCGGVTDNGNGTWSTTTAVTAPCSVSASFTLNNYTVTPTVVGGNGTISPASPQSVQHGGSTFFVLTPAADYEIDAVTGCDGDLSGNNYLIVDVTADCTVTATFILP